MSSSRAPNICLNSNEINVLLYAYLRESGFEHAAYVLRGEARLDGSPSAAARVKPGLLVDLLAKALLYVEVETHFKDGSAASACDAPFSLLEPHVCSIPSPAPVDNDQDVRPEPPMDDTPGDARVQGKKKRKKASSLRPDHNGKRKRTDAGAGLDGAPVAAEPPAAPEAGPSRSSSALEETGHEVEPSIRLQDASIPEPAKASAGTQTAPSSAGAAGEASNAHAQDAPMGVSTRSGSSKRLRITLSSGSGCLRLSCRRATRIRTIVKAWAKEMGGCPEQWRLWADVRAVEWASQNLGVYPEISLKDIGAVDGTDIYFMREMVGGKPVIYLFSPTPVSARVELSLVKEWRFSAIYPVAEVIRDRRGMDAIAWDVDVDPISGTLVDKRTSLEVAYLYWEATTTKMCRPPSPLPEEQLASLSEAFNPAIADVSLSSSVVLDVAFVPAYLDAALKAMSLHTEARTSFITYWLPAILRHQRIALRFLPQTAYEPAAPLSVTPCPDAVTRVFMLFRRVDDDVTGMSILPEEWADVVGVDVARASDASLFRVLEWGGMEVTSY